MSKRSTGYLSYLFDLIGQHKVLNKGRISDHDQIANQITFLETMTQQYLALLQLIFPKIHMNEAKLGKYAIWFGCPSAFYKSDRNDLLAFSPKQYPEGFES